MIHTVRDGRDAASSVTTKTWGPDDVIKGIDWWADRLRWIDRGVSGVEDGAEYGLPADRSTWSSWTTSSPAAGRKPRGALRLPRRRAGRRDARVLRRRDERVRDAPGALGRGVGAIGRARVRRRYERTLAQLRDEGNHVAAPLRDSLERLG